MTRLQNALPALNRQLAGQRISRPKGTVVLLPNGGLILSLSLSLRFSAEREQANTGRVS